MIKNLTVSIVAHAGGIIVSPAYTCKECVKHNKNIGVVCESISI